MLRLLQPVHDRSHVVGHAPQDFVEVLDSSGGGNIDRADDLLQASAGGTDRHVQVHDGMTDAAGDAEAGDESGHRSADAQQAEAEGDPIGHVLILVAALVNELFLQGKQLLGRLQQAVGGQIVVQPRDFPANLIDRRGRGAVRPLDFPPCDHELLITVANSFRQGLLVEIIRQPFRFGERTFDMFAGGGNGL